MLLRIKNGNFYVKMKVFVPVHGVETTNVI